MNDDKNLIRASGMLRAVVAAIDFFEKYAIGGKLAPSCFVCGRTVSEAPAVKHAELAGIVCCFRCKSASDKALQEGSGT